METIQIFIQNQSSSKPLLTLESDSPYIDDIILSSDVLEFIRDNLEQCEISKEEPEDELELVLKVKITKQDFLHIKYQEAYDDIQQIIIDTIGSDTNKQRDFLREFLNGL